MVSGDEDTTISGQLTATDIDGNPPTYSIASQPQHGTIVVNPDWTFNYTPALNYYGQDSFIYAAYDGIAGSTATVTIDVAPIPDAPAAQPMNVSVNEDAVFNGQLQASDADGDQLSYALTIAPVHGTAAVATDGTFTYTPMRTTTGSMP